MVVPLTVYAFFNEKALNVMPNHEPRILQSLHTMTTVDLTCGNFPQ